MRHSRLWTRKWPLLAVTMILLIALLGISSSVVSAEPLSGTADEVVWGPHGSQDTYVDIQLDGGHILPGWCVDHSLYIWVGNHYTATIYDYFGDYYQGKLGALPSWIKHHGSWTVDWNSIAYVINHKQGNWEDIQQALWYFSDDGVKPGGTAGLMVEAALAYNAGPLGPFVPGPGQLKPIICYIENCQTLFYECQIQSPSISIDKVGAFSGSEINYTFNVTNTGNVNLTNVMVTDPKITVLGDPITLAPGAWNNTAFTGSYTLTQEDFNAERVVNTATAIGTPPHGPVVTNTDTETIEVPHPTPEPILPELPTIALLSIGLVALAGWFGVRRRRSTPQA